ncbi:MAG TPA: class I SAM-dependent methyltransferase [Bacteroidales bacterium]|nr:class I SAM-dependent methyltransferase [Bacteroidales bacterium]
MQYDPIKHSLGKVFNRSPFLRKLFYRMLDLLLLRTWHVKKEIREWAKGRKGPQSILDAGSGFGQYSYFLSGFDPEWQILAVDVKAEQIADCTGFFHRIGKKNVAFELADLTCFANPHAFDLILSVDVMEHIEEDVRVFRNFYESLRPGGMLLISTPSDLGGSDVHDHGAEASFIDEHVRDGYNAEEIREKLRQAGFGRIGVRYSYGKPGQSAWRLSMKYPIGMLNRSRLFFIVLPFYYLFTFPVALVLNRMDVGRQHSAGTGLIVTAFKE